ncbi:uncharacterized protein Z519_08609 [Cladophialophora bantiana CBS 173.52]|uniref:VOC domain-containing protein n=1 Tax=Cladophialophora bantiana (strain ATCC 10958 / CBS 173.52 / CDC B-1940 / NIH 8579) TaxID=1442370 RepID=A0A0D2ELD7_CLAB1|nr:uncharacterized protein Z519_08609 [Cladophialophora bantiana CBS 173.52]KIW90826.1 hypothetical protein Z519_08609 [Cladophialophora bantiana CBS 173.52]
MTIDWDAPTPKVLPPAKLAHVVLRTNKLEEMVNFYKTFLGAEAMYENEVLAFLTYDDEHHRIALIQVPGTKDKDRQSCGLEHIAFAYESLTDLLLAYRQRKVRSINPFWPVNHGPTTSIYYKDPDGNMLETQVDNFDDADSATKFMKSPAFAENPIGVDFDPEEFIDRLSAGESEAELKKRKEIGPRGIPEFA